MLSGAASAKIPKMASQFVGAGQRREDNSRQSGRLQTIGAGFRAHSDSMGHRSLRQSRPGSEWALSYGTGVAIKYKDINEQVARDIGAEMHTTIKDTMARSATSPTRLSRPRSTTVGKIKNLLGYHDS